MSHTSSPRTRVRRFVAIGISCATLAVTLNACSSGGKAFDSVRAGGENTSRVRPYHSWNDLIAEARGDLAEDPVDAAVVGSVTDVRPGRSFRWEFKGEGKDKEVRIETKFGAKEAMISTYHLTVNTTSVVGGDDQLKSASSVRVGIAVDPDVSLEDVKNDYSDISGAVFFLQQSPVYDYESGIFAIVEDGTLMATPDDNGDLSFPLLDADDPLQPPRGTRAADLKK